MQNGKDPGKFRQLDEILYVEGYPGYQQLMNVASHHMELVCEVKGICLDVSPQYTMSSSCHIINTRASLPHI